MKKRPPLVSILAIAMITTSLILISIHLQSLHVLPSFSLFTITKPELTAYVAFFSDLAKLMTSTVPLILGIGLWQLYPWARAISICLFVSVLLPTALAVVGLVSDRRTAVGLNVGICFACGVGLAILLNPQITGVFRKYHNLN